jgi:hypothetical protein
MLEPTRPEVLECVRAKYLYAVYDVGRFGREMMPVAMAMLLGRCDWLFNEDRADGVGA